ncbi:MAG TPA: M14 family zinc carboxypeptidase [Blastocatellia bacterium]|nr:M14 family zinc carboxypeptidase [Blastocatellia bacterium]
MHPLTFIRSLISVTCLLAVVTLAASAQTAVQIKPSRDPKQPVDEEYTQKIREYTTAPFFNSPLTEYLPASKTVPTPKAVLGDVAGAPGKLPYAAEVYRYMRMLEKASPRVKVYSIGTTEEGREMIAVAVSSETNISKIEENRARLSKLADPRSINLNDDEAEKLVAASVPVYYITGTIHSPETGAPTALMELAYRLAVDESPWVKNIRDNVITLITPVVEVDGRDRMVDVYNWHRANPDKNWPSLVYWGHYVAHDNNRDSMSLSLKLTQNVLKTFTGWRAQVLHDLHESVPYLYDNTIGDQPYNAWLDPILTDEWQLIGWNNVSEMTRFGMPGVFTHGTFDTWSPSYLMFIAASHNGISRLYETFGNGGADTVERTLSPQEYSRTWYKQNPPLPRAKWSQRNNNNYEQTGLLVSLGHFATNNKYFLRNFYTKSKNSILKPKTAGPAAYVFPADDPRPGGQAELLRLLQAQGCEVHRATAPFTVTLPAKKKPARPTNAIAGGTNGTNGHTEEPATTRQFPAGSYVVRMDQPYSRIADMMLDYQYWAPNDPQRNIYDDTAWTFGELGNVQVVRVTDVKALDATMEKVGGEVRAPGSVKGSGGSVFVVNHNADNALVTLRYRFKDASFEAAEEPFEAAGQKFNRGSFIIRNVPASELSRAAAELGLQLHAVAAAPPVKTHPTRAPRIALMHTWLSTQDEGWWRLEFDRHKVPYAYISTQDVSKDDNLNAKYDVIIFAPVGRSNPQLIVSGMPMFGNPLPWKTTSLTPNIGKIDSTDDMRPGLGWTGLQNLQNFVRRGGLLITANDTANFAVSFGFTPGISTAAPQRLRVTGSVLRSRMVDAASPIAYGYSDRLAIFCASGPIFNLSNTVGGRGGRRFTAEGGERLTGRGTADDPDTPQNRPVAELPEEPKAEVWEAVPLTDEQRRNGVTVIPPAARPRVVLRYADARELLVSGLLEAGTEIAQHAAVVDVPYEQGHVVLFSNNPFWRAETQGSYFLVFNAILNFDNLNAGRKLAEK